jgi:serine/threonine protein kinase
VTDAVLQGALGPAYRLEREVGHGAIATVYVARDAKHHRQVALKVLDFELGISIGPERFRREMGMVARLRHPHIVPVHDSGMTSAGQLWFTMPYIGGHSLRTRLARDRQLPVEDACRIARDLADALQYAHARGVVHRDIKPENILLAADGHAYLADFGIARAAASGAVGTPAYMSPEQGTADMVVDSRTDLYSLGAVLHEMLTGELATGPASSVRWSRPSVPPEVDQAITRAMSAKAADRFSTAADFARALGPQRRPSLLARLHSETILISIALALLVAAIILHAHHHGR